MSATLGGLIKDYRLQKGIPQLDIAYKLGWKDSTILSRIEQGVTKTPSRSVVDNIAKELNLSEIEKNHLLLVGGYLPTTEEIEQIRIKTDKTMKDYRYPLILEDFSWRIIHQNEAAKHLENKDEQEEIEIEKNVPNALVYNFQEEYHKEKFSHLINEKDKEAFLISITTQFISEHKNNTSQKWYKDMMKKLMAKPEFRHIYKIALKQDTSKLVLDYTQQTVVHRRNPSNILSFFMFTVPILSDNRFFFEFHVPSDAKTYEYYEKNKF